MKQFITKRGGSTYYLVDADEGGFLTPSGHAERLFGILETRNGSNDDIHRLSVVARDDNAFFPQVVRDVAIQTIADYPGDVKDEKWLREVYTHFKHCYSPDGVNRNVSDSKVYGKFWHNAEQESAENPYHHLGYLYVRSYDAGHTPRVDLMGEYAPSLEG